MKVFITLGIIILAIGGSIWVGKIMHDQKTSDDAQENAYIVKANTDIGGNFSLTNHKGEKISLSDYPESLKILYFGYTYCPDFCPAELSNISKVMDMLGAASLKVQPFFITIDPQRDDLETLSTYMQNFHPQFIALRGEEKETELIKNAYKLYAVKAEEKDHPEDYLIDHSTFVYLLDKNNRLLSLFKYATPPEIMYREIKKYV